jgi:hypothetical protein
MGNAAEGKPPVGKPPAGKPPVGKILRRRKVPAAQCVAHQQR